MQIRQVLLILALPTLAIGAGLIAPDQAHAARSSALLAQAAPEPPVHPPDGRRHPHRPDFAAAAEKLGVSEAELKAALGVPEHPPQRADRSQRPPRPDFAAAATKLGVTEQQLIDALGIPHRPDADRAADRPTLDRPTDRPYPPESAPTGDRPIPPAP